MVCASFPPPSQLLGHTERGRSTQAFTLIELLVAIAILAVIVGLLLAAVQRARDAANRTECLNNLKQIGLALHGYHDSNGCFPHAYDCRALFVNPSHVWDGTRRIVTKGWATLILPFVEQGNLDQQGYASYQGEKLPLFHCPADPRANRVWTRARFGSNGLTDYLAVTSGPPWRDHNDGVMFGSSHIRMADITDGTSNTLLVGERPPAPDLYWGWWAWSAMDASTGMRDTFAVYETGEKNNPKSQSCIRLLPENFRAGVGNFCDVHHFWSEHPGGANWIFADGSVRFLSYAKAGVMPALATRAAGEVVSELQ